MAVRVRGLADFQRVAAAAGGAAPKITRDALREVAEPIRADAEQLAQTGIRRIGPRWSRMRVGVTRRLVYVAPRQRGVKGRGADPRRRPKFADLLDRRAMTPALERNEDNIERRVEQAFDALARRWNSSG